MKQPILAVASVATGTISFLALLYLYFIDQGDSLLTPMLNYVLLGLIATSGVVGIKASRSTAFKNASIIWLIFGLIGIAVSWYLSRLSFSF